MLTIKKGLTSLQGFIQALTDLRLPEVKSFQTQSFKPKNKKVTKTV